ncbi:MAG: DnaB-like helicase C-terminal domain-containing protein [Pseudomonadota bacterium]
MTKETSEKNRDDFALSSFQPDIERIRAVRNCEVATVETLSKAAGLDPSQDFADYKLSDFDWRDTDMSRFVVRSPLPEQGTALAFLETMDSERRSVEVAELQQLSDPDNLKPGEPSNGFRSFLHAVTGAVVSANEAVQSGDAGFSGLSTGFYDLDRKLGGLHKSDLLILAGRPSMGVTTLATNLAANISSRSEPKTGTNGIEGSGGVVGFFSLEMSSEQLAARIISRVSEVPAENIRRGDMIEAEFKRFVEAARSLEESTLYINDTPKMGIDELIKFASDLNSKVGLDVLFIDKLQVLKDNSGKISAAGLSRKLKELAKTLHIPVIVTSSVAAPTEKRRSKRPALTDLSGFGAIVQDADVVMFLHRDEYFLERDVPDPADLEAMSYWQERMEFAHGKAEIIIGKQRHGRIGSIDLAFDDRLLRFENLVQPWQQ